MWAPTVNCNLCTNCTGGEPVYKLASTNRGEVYIKEWEGVLHLKMTIVTCKRQKADSGPISFQGSYIKFI